MFNNIRITLYYSVSMRISDETVRISDEAERVQSVSYFDIRSLSGLYTVVYLREGKRGTCPGPSLLGAPSRYFARKYYSFWMKKNYCLII